MFAWETQFATKTWLHHNANKKEDILLQAHAKKAKYGKESNNKMKHSQTRNGPKRVKHGQTRNGHEHVKHGQTRNGLEQPNTDKHGSQTRGQPAQHSTTQLRDITHSVRSHDELPESPAFLPMSSGSENLDYDQQNKDQQPAVNCIMQGASCQQLSHQ